MTPAGAGDRRRLILHIGHGKTGSSAIQSFLSANRDRLAAARIDYPPLSSEAEERATRGDTMSGNLAMGADWVQAIHRRMAESRQNVVLFSNETVFHKVGSDPAPFADLARAHALTVVMFLRDPFDHVLSSYDQALKRGRLPATPESHAGKSRVLEQAADLLDGLDHFGVPVVLRNYSRSPDLLATFLGTLPLADPDGFLMGSTVGDRPVNRSLAAGERSFLRALVQSGAGSLARGVADALVDGLPRVPADRVSLSPEVVAELSAAWAGLLTRINARLPADERLRLIAPEPADPRSVPATLNAEQLSVIAAAIAREMRRMATPSAKQEEFDTFWTLADKHETGARVSRGEQAFLLRKALEIRPGAPVVKRRLRAILASRLGEPQNSGPLSG
ncbi:hypothetical protein [Jannaschia rubra]|uniref:hypothetical protein n=1 Tax=Jannaschia rubra TaxID=282197 RepID=UPI002493716E|nr:hypothetical protein [Jannaschia rubra]